MDAYLVWFCLALILVMTELFTGTFYLLMVAIGFVVGGVTAMVGLPLTSQLMLGALVGGIATLLLHRVKRGTRVRNGHSDLGLDIGQMVQVHTWVNGVARIEYRGAQWDAVMQEGVPEQTGTLAIKAIRGSHLVVGPAR